MRALVTGAAGFIGSHLAAQLLAQGHQVVGIDAFTDGYDPSLKQQNVESLQADPRFELVAADLLDVDLPPLLDGVEVLFHLAGQAGVRGGWGADFATYLDRNLRASQRLLEAARGVSLAKVIFASSSSVYGQAASLPAREDDPCAPLSPYAITKLAAEQLGLAHCQRYDIPFVALRYFAVYGPRQRPDMAFHRFISAIRDRRDLMIYGDGHQTRDFTYVNDVVEATIRAASQPITGEVVNVGSGRSTSVLDVVEHLEVLMDSPARVQWLPEAPGEPRHTRADLAKAKAVLGYTPRVELAEGLSRQVASQLPIRSQANPNPRHQGSENKIRTLPPAWPSPRR